MSELNQEALEKAYAAYYVNIGVHSEKIKAAIRTYLASLPPVDAGEIAAKLEWVAQWLATGNSKAVHEARKALVWLKDEFAATCRRAEAAEDEVTRLKAEIDALKSHGVKLAIKSETNDHRAKKAEAEAGRLQRELRNYDAAVQSYGRENEELKAELAEGCDLLDRFDGHLPTVRRYLERVRSFLDGQKTGEATAICKSCGQSFPLSAPHDCPGLTAGSQKGNSE